MDTQELMRLRLLKSDELVCSKLLGEYEASIPTTGNKVSLYMYLVQGDEIALLDEDLLPPTEELGTVRPRKRA